MCYGSGSPHHIIRECPTKKTARPTEKKWTISSAGTPLQYEAGGKLIPSITESQVVEGETFGLLEGINVERIYSRVTGNCPEAAIKIGDVKCRCLLDSGSEVPMVTESFYHQSLEPVGYRLIQKDTVLNLTAANCLGVPYVGYFEPDIAALDEVYSGVGMIVVRDSPNTVQRAKK